MVSRRKAERVGTHRAAHRLLGNRERIISMARLAPPGIFNLEGGYETASLKSRASCLKFCLSQARALGDAVIERIVDA